MWLVICRPNDASALWAVKELKKRGVVPIEVVTPDELACAPTFECRVGPRSTFARVVLSRGREIKSNQVRGVLNRVDAFEPPHIGQFSEGERTYVRAEWHAVLLAWLAALPQPVINPAT